MTARNEGVREKGFTLIEVLLAMAVSAIVGTLAISAIMQFASVSAAEQDTMLASSQIKRFSAVLGEDLVCADSGEVLDGGQTLVLYLSEFEFGELVEPVSYSLSYSLVGDEIYRSSGEGTVSTAKGVTSVSFGPEGAVGTVCTVDITVVVGDVSDSSTLVFHRRPS